jgi:hypothetical protein
VRDNELQVGAGEWEGESTAVSTCRPPKRIKSSLVDAREHDEAVHEQQPKATPADPKDQQCNPDLPSRPCREQKVSQTSLARNTSLRIPSSSCSSPYQRPYTARGLIFVILILALDCAAYPWVRTCAATSQVDQRNWRLQLRLRILCRVTPSSLHLCVMFYVRVVGIIERARAVVATLVCLFAVVLVCGKLDGGARKVAEEVEGLLEGFLRAAVEAQRVHDARCIAKQEEES